MGRAGAWHHGTCTHARCWRAPIVARALPGTYYGPQAERTRCIPIAVLALAATAARHARGRRRCCLGPHAHQLRLRHMHGPTAAGRVSGQPASHDKGARRAHLLPAQSGPHVRRTSRYYRLQSTVDHKIGPSLDCADRADSVGGSGRLRVAPAWRGLDLATPLMSQPMQCTTPLVWLCSIELRFWKTKPCCLAIQQGCMPFVILRHDNAHVAYHCARRAEVTAVAVP